MRHVARVPNKSHLRLGPRVPLQQRHQRSRHRQVRQGLAAELRLHPAIPGDFSMSIDRVTGRQCLHELVCRVGIAYLFAFSCSSSGTITQAAN